MLFLLTVASTTAVGMGNYLAFRTDFGLHDVSFGLTTPLMLQGLLYSIAVLGILGAHEMGHYVACRIYDVDATLPFFIPFISLSGTLGAVIKIREAFPDRKALFDIGVAGPIAGFVTLIPVVFWGMRLSNVLPVPPHMAGYTLGEPLLFKAAEWVTFGSIADGYSVNIHPVVFAAWFGMLATAWNLLPFGQLDGGHLTYATLGDRSRYFSIATVAVSVAMCFVSYSWIFMTLMMIAMLYFLGSRHPRVLNEYEPLGTGRYLVALLALVMFIVCFMPVPIDPIK